jgi:hypothetical protein
MVYCYRRLHATKITWTKAHDKDKDNNYVDILALKHTETNKYQLLNIFQIPIDPTERYLPNIPYIEDTIDESTLRKNISKNNNGSKKPTRT